MERRVLGVGLAAMREQLTASVTDQLLAEADLMPGMRVLDIGSGAGISSIASARTVSPGGSVVGADISTPLVEFASLRTRELDLTNATFVVADMQYDQVEGAPFDAAISQFGVMFFDEPALAFSNIRRHVAPGGRLTFACWLPLAQNPWHINHALGPFLPPSQPLEPGKWPTGAFSLADGDATDRHLGAAGWTNIERRLLRLTIVVDREAIFDDGQLTFLGVAENQLDEAKQTIEDHLTKFRRDDGRYDATLAVQLVSATS